jgi:hypothetical protein
MRAAYHFDADIYASAGEPVGNARLFEAVLAA